MGGCERRYGEGWEGALLMFCFRFCDKRRRCLKATVGTTSRLIVFFFSTYFVDFSVY